ncbi:MAG: hypothetical protein KJO07_11360, partial [Deltaproteobacteria bacterium]|nr:hypothetical protein [Deltaproteobacteria bacterium]
TSTAAGVECQQLEAVTASSNIVWGNQKEGQDELDEVAGGMCLWSYSTIEQPVVGNLEVAPAFVGPDDYHLTPTGNDLLEGAAEPGTSTATDIDGQPRPQGSGPDIGADEIAAPN